MIAGNRPAFVARLECPACASRRSETIFKSPLDAPEMAHLLYTDLKPSDVAGGEYRVEKCAECATLFQGEVGSPDFLHTLYSEWLDNEADPEAAFADYRFDMAHPLLSRDAHEIMAISTHLKVPLGDLVLLDFGMGWGSWARTAAQLGCQSHGNDLDEKRMRYVADRGVRTIQFDEIDGLGAHFINTEQVMEHLPDPADAMATLVKGLRPGGILKISVPAPNGIEAALRSGGLTKENIMPLSPLEHLNCFNRRSLALLAERFGLRPVRPSYAARYAFLGQKRALDLRHPRHAAKALVRPVVQYRSRSNLYAWFVAAT